MTRYTRRIDSEADFIALEAAWNDLEERSDQATVFTSYHWARACWQEHDRWTRLCILATYHDGTLVGIAPLCVRKPPLRPATLLHIGMRVPQSSAADYLDVLVAASYEEAVMSDVLAFLAAHADLWDVLDWHQLSDTSLSQRLLEPLAHRHGFPVRSAEQSVCHTITLPPTWRAYLDQLSGNMRGTIERKTRKIARECGAEIRQVADEGELDQIMTTFLVFQQQRWDPAHARQREQFNRFSRALARTMLRQGCLDLSVLWAEGVPVAIIWSFRFHKTVYFYLSAFEQDERWNKYSVGTILLADSIRRAIEDGYQVFDLMRGNYEYKTRFASTPRRNHRIRVFRTARLRRLSEIEDGARHLRSHIRRYGRQVLDDVRRRLEARSGRAGPEASQAHQTVMES